MGIEKDRGPFRRGRFGGWRGRNLLGLHLEDAELSWIVVQLGLFAQRAFGEARAGAAGGDELPGELDEVRGNLDGRLDRLKDGCLAEGYLLVQEESLRGIRKIEGGVFDRLVRGPGSGGAASAVRRRGGGVETNLVGQADGQVGCGKGGFGDELELSGNLCGCTVMTAHRPMWRLAGRRDERGSGFTVVFVEFGKEVVLNLGDGLGVASGDFGGGFGLAGDGVGLADCTFCLFSEKGAIALGLGVAFCNGGGDTGGSLAGCRRCSRRCGRAGRAGAAGTVSREAFGDLLLEGEGIERRF